MPLSAMPAGVVDAIASAILPASNTLGELRQRLTKVVWCSVPSSCWLRRVAISKASERSVLSDEVPAGRVMGHNHRIEGEVPFDQ